MMKLKKYVPLMSAVIIFFYTPSFAQIPLDENSNGKVDIADAVGVLQTLTGERPRMSQGRDLGIYMVAVPSYDGHTVTYTLFLSGSDGTTTPNGDPASSGFVHMLCPVTVTDILPPGVSLVSATGTGWNCTGTTCVQNFCNQGGYSYNAPSHLGGPITIVATYLQEGTYQNCATIANGSNAGAWAESNLTNNTSCVTTTAVFGPGRDIALEKLAEISADGQTVTYTMNVTGSNGAALGPNAVDTLTLTCPVTITDILPPCATLISSSSAWTRTGSNYVLAMCNMGLWLGTVGGTISVPNDTPISILPPLTIVANVPPGETITNCASISNSSNEGGLAESTLVNNTSCVTTSIPGGTISVNALLDGMVWTGTLSFDLAGPQTIPGSSVPLTSVAAATGAYTLSYTSGGPSGTTLLSTTPSATQTLTNGGAIVYTLYFRTNKPDTDTITVNATLDGAPWAGPLNFTVNGPQTMSDSTVPQTSTNLSIGSYALTYTSGGPSGATFLNVTPSTTQNLTTGTAMTFTLNFTTRADAFGTIVVNAALFSGAGGSSPWTGPVSFTLTGPQTITGTSTSQTFIAMPIGTYTLTYTSGGPFGVQPFNVTPSAIQMLTSMGTSIFTLNFQ